MILSSDVKVHTYDTFEAEAILLQWGDSFTVPNTVSGYPLTPRCSRRLASYAAMQFPRRLASWQSPACAAVQHPLSSQAAAGATLHRANQGGRCRRSIGGTLRVEIGPGTCNWDAVVFFFFYFSNVNGDAYRKCRY